MANPKEITIIGRDNTSLEYCINKQVNNIANEQVNNISVEALGFKKTNENDEDKKTVYSGLVHLFLTSKNGASQEEFAELLKDTKRADKKDEELYNPDERKFCNFVGVVSKEFKITNRKISNLIYQMYIYTKYNHRENLYYE